MINRYFILLFLPIVLSSCSNSPQTKTQQRPLATDQTSVSTVSQTSEAESNVNSNLDENSAPIAPIATQGKSYSPQIVNNFMEACTQDGSSQTNCGCRLNTFKQNFSEPEFLRMEQQFTATGKIPEFVIQEISNNCSNSELQTPIARSQQEYLEDEQQRRFIAMERQAGIERTNMMSAAQAKILEDQPRRIAESVESALRYSSATAGAGFRSLEHPCDYPNQRDSQGNSCGDRSAVVRPGGRF